MIDMALMCAFSFALGVMLASHFFLSQLSRLQKRIRSLRVEVRALRGDYT